MTFACRMLLLFLLIDRADAGFAFGALTVRRSLLAASPMLDLPDHQVLMSHSGPATDDASLFFISGALVGAAFGGPLGAVLGAGITGGLRVALDDVHDIPPEDSNRYPRERASSSALIVLAPFCVVLVAFKIVADFGVAPSAPGGLVAAAIILLLLQQLESR